MFPLAEAFIPWKNCALFPYVFCYLPMATFMAFSQVLSAKVKEEISWLQINFYFQLPPLFSSLAQRDGLLNHNYTSQSFLFTCMAT